MFDFLQINSLKKRKKINFTKIIEQEVLRMRVLKVLGMRKHKDDGEKKEDEISMVNQEFQLENSFCEEKEEDIKQNVEKKKEIINAMINSLEKKQTLGEAGNQVQDQQKESAEKPQQKNSKFAGQNQLETRELKVTKLEKSPSEEIEGIADNPEEKKVEVLHSSEDESESDEKDSDEGKSEKKESTKKLILFEGKEEKKVASPKEEEDKIPLHLISGVRLEEKKEAKASEESLVSNNSSSLLDSAINDGKERSAKRKKSQFYHSPKHFEKKEDEKNKIDLLDLPKVNKENEESQKKEGANINNLTEMRDVEKPRADQFLSPR